jgi:hypothetical protein
MNKIIEFLQSQSGSGNIPANRIDKEKLSKSFIDLKSFFDTSESGAKRILKLKSKPQIKKGQIWLCKQEYYDALGNQIIGNTPYLVLVISNTENIANESFVRIHPISPFTEFQAADDILISDNSITGFEFIIETWNEQPILTELLDEYVGELDNDEAMVHETEVNLSNNQKEFRKAEIRNTEYLRQSINSLIEFNELKEENSVLLNIENSLHFANSDNKEIKTISLINEPGQTYLQAAKKGRFKDRPTFIFHKTIEGVDINIKILEENDIYVLAVKQPKEIELKDSHNNLLKQSTPNLYDNLRSGLYFIKVKGISNEIRIKLS